VWTYSTMLEQKSGAAILAGITAPIEVRGVPDLAWDVLMSQHLFKHPPHLPLIAPSILAADFAILGPEAADVEKAGADLLHVHILDGPSSPNPPRDPNIALPLPPPSNLLLDSHLMVPNPDEHIQAFAKASPKTLPFHIEARRGESAKALIKRIHDIGCTAG